MRIVCILVVSMVASAAAAARAEEAAVTFKLRPAEGLRTMDDAVRSPMPFTQALPFVAGAVAAEDVGYVAVDGEPIDATTRILNYWPDGSVRMVLVEGVLPARRLAEGSLAATFTDDAPSTPRRNPVHSVEVSDDRLIFRDGEQRRWATLQLEAAWSPITEAKIIYPNDPELNDEVAQYGWAHPLADLDEAAESRPLQPRLREWVVKRENAVFADYVARGDAGATEPGGDLEWQLHLRVYRAAPVVRWQMTWAMHWDPDDYALTHAGWRLRPTDAIRSASIGGADNAAEALSIEGGGVWFEPNGQGIVEGLAEGPKVIDRPDDHWHQLLMRTDGLAVGLAVCDLSRLGPSHVQVDEQTLAVASWSDRSELGMDLRSSVQQDEFGIGGGDLESDGKGVAFSLDGALVVSEDIDEVRLLTEAETRRDYLWFPGAKELYETGALQDRVHPDTLGAGEERPTRLSGTQESVYFLLLSRDYWRWYGTLNYGDVRTNFKAREDRPDRGLFVDRWGLHGRYGWRNGSSDVHGRMLYFGLLLEDRRVILAALDYARHVADVDVKHASFFAEPEGDQGGMHRRNKDHWSGGIEPQYTTSRGLYFASWMTGNDRLGQVLEEVRAYTANTDRQPGSAFRAEAWIHRYAETHDPQDLHVARRLLDACAERWSRRGDPPEALQGLSVMYHGNFRRVGNGMLVLIDFHHNTGEREYLEAILESVRHHGIRAYDDSYLAAYLLANGIAPERIGDTLLEEARRRLPRQRSGSADKPKAAWTYLWLRERMTGNRQSYNIGRAMRYPPFALQVLHGKTD